MTRDQRADAGTAASSTAALCQIVAEALWLDPDTARIGSAVDAIGRLAQCCSDDLQEAHRDVAMTSAAGRQLLEDLRSSLAATAATARLVGRDTALDADMAMAIGGIADRLSELTQRLDAALHP